VVEANRQRAQSGEQPAADMLRSRPGCHAVPQLTPPMRLPVSLGAASAGTGDGPVDICASQFDVKVSTAPAIWNTWRFNLCGQKHRNCVPDILSVVRDQGAFGGRSKVAACAGQDRYTVGTQFHRQQSPTAPAVRWACFSQRAAARVQFAIRVREWKRARLEQRQLEQRLRAARVAAAADVESTYEQVRNRQHDDKQFRSGHARTVAADSAYSGRIVSGRKASVLEFLDAQRAYRDHHAKLQ